jgi:hypothetical protein
VHFDRFIVSLQSIDPITVACITEMKCRNNVGNFVSFLVITFVKYQLLNNEVIYKFFKVYYHLMHISDNAISRFMSRKS